MNRVTGAWADVTAAGGEFWLVVQGLDYYIDIYDGTCTLRHHIPTPEGLWHLKASALSDGSICAIGQGHLGGSTQIVTVVDNVPTHWTIPGLLNWGGAAIESLDYAWHAAIQTSPNTYEELVIYKDRSLTRFPPQPVPIWPGGDGTTSGGFLGYINGRLQWTDPNMFLSRDGLVLTYPCWAGPAVVGQAEGGAWWSLDDTSHGMVFRGDTFFPRMAEAFGRYAICGRQYPADVVFIIIERPYPSEQPTTPTTPIEPEPPIPPQEPDVSTPYHLSTVQAVRQQYPTGEDLGIERAFRITNEVAWIHKDEGFGLRRKPTGNNYLGYAVDIVFHKPSMQFVDVLGSSETAGNPQWSEVDGAIESEWADPLDPETLEPEPDVDPDPTPDLAGRVTALENDLATLRATLRGWVNG